MAITGDDTWTNPIIKYLELGIFELEEEKTMRQQCSRYTKIGRELYRRGYSRPLLKCITKEHAEYVLQDIHERVCRSDSGVRTMVAKVLIADYYWPTVQSDCA